MQGADVEINIFVQTKMYSRIYESNVTVNLQDLGLSPGCWLAAILVLLAEGSRVRRELTSRVGNIIKAIAIGKNSEAFLQIASLPTENISASSLRDMFSALEEAVDRAEARDQCKYKISQEFRGFVYQKIQILGGKGDIHRHSVGYKTIFQVSRQPRKIISDFSDDENAPLGAIKVDDVSGIHEQIHQRLEADLERIISACGDELAWHKNARDYLHYCKGFNPTPRELELVRKAMMIRSSRSTLANSGMFDIQVEVVISAILIVIESDRLCYLSREYKPVFDWYAPHIRSIQAGFGLKMESAHFCMLLDRLSSNEMKAIFNLLLCHTGWNAGSLIDMELWSIDRSGGDYVFQGFKSKTGDYTPHMHMDKYYSHGKSAIDLLLWNREQLVRFELLESSSPYLWYSWSQTFEVYEKQSIGIFINNKDFLARHNLPGYSFDQIRSQVMSRDILVANESIDGVRRKSGHLSASTTHGYLQQLIFHRLASVVNLDFQRKLEATVIWDLRQDNGNTAGDSTTELNRHIRLTPIGDGASCKSPTTAPLGFEMVDGLCRADGCHLGNGCPNRVINIDADALRALVRKRKYYLTNWHRLYLDNKHRFELIHGPALMFSFCLYDYISGSDYSWFLREIEAEVSNEK